MIDFFWEYLCKFTRLQDTIFSSHIFVVRLTIYISIYTPLHPSEMTIGASQNFYQRVACNRPFEVEIVHCWASSSLIFESNRLLNWLHDVLSERLWRLQRQHNFVHLRHSLSYQNVMRRCLALIDFSLKLWVCGEAGFHLAKTASHLKCLCTNILIGILNVPRTREILLHLSLLLFQSKNSSLPRTYLDLSHDRIDV